MQKIRQLFALMFAVALFAGALQADAISYFEGSGDNVSLKSERDVTINAWSASEVKYTTADGAGKSVKFKNVVSLSREYGSMSAALSDALSQVGGDPAAALDALKAIKEEGNKLDKEEASFMVGQIYYKAAAANQSAINSGINAYQDYLRSYKAGYFARDAYRNLADLQVRAKKVADARKTFKDMIGADSSLRREGNQWLGELESSAGNWKQAISAFQSARSAADDQNNKFLAQAWEGLCTLKDGNTAAAKALLEPIVDDEDFDDDNSFQDEIALAVAYRAMGDVHAEGQLWEKAYDMYIKGAYYSWWTGGSHEGYCMAEAYVCAKKLEGTDEDVDWGERRSKLRRALAVGFPSELQRVDK